MKNRGSIVLCMFILLAQQTVIALEEEIFGTVRSTTVKMLNSGENRTFCDVISCGNQSVEQSNPMIMEAHTDIVLSGCNACVIGGIKKDFSGAIACALSWVMKDGADQQQIIDKFTAQLSDFFPASVYVVFLLHNDRITKAIFKQMLQMVNTQNMHVGEIYIYESDTDIVNTISSTCLNSARASIRINPKYNNSISVSKKDDRLLSFSYAPNSMEMEITHEIIIPQYTAQCKRFE